MAILWLRVALGCYAVGLLYALVALTRTSDLLNRIALHAAYLGMVFHFVSLTDAFLVSGQVALTSVHNAESVLGFLVMVVFMLVYLVYQTTSPGIVIFPLVFLLTFIAATGQAPFLLTSPGLHKGWLLAHIALIFTGYAALILSFGASLLYLIQERSLKSKKPGGILSRLPALEVIDEPGVRERDGAIGRRDRDRRSRHVSLLDRGAIRHPSENLQAEPGHRVVDHLADHAVRLDLGDDRRQLRPARSHPP